MKRVTAYLYFALTIGYLFLMFSVAKTIDVFLLVATVVVFSVPGVFIGRILFGSFSRKHPEGLIFGTVLGLASSEYVALAAAYIIGWRPYFLLSAVLIFSIATYLLFRVYRPRRILPESEPWSARDYDILWIALGLLLLFVWIPFRNFGRLTPSGYAFTWLFGFDFILRSSYSAALTLGMPPDFLHLSGNVFHYYLVSHTPSALAYALGGKHGSLPSILLLYGLTVDVLLVVCMFAFLHRFIKQRVALACTIFVMMGAYSYYWFYVAARWAFLNSEYTLSLALPRALVSYGDVSHLFQRLFLVEPQAISSLCLLLTVLFILEELGYSLNRYDMAALIGLWLGIGFGIDALIGLVAALWFGLVYLVRWFRNRALIRQEFGRVVVATVVCAAIYLSFFVFGMYSFSDGGQLHLEQYSWILRNAPVYFLIEFGPMIVLGIWGIWMKLRAEKDRPSPGLLLLAVLVLLLVVFVRVGVLPRERLAERLLPITALVGTGYFFEYAFRQNGRRWVKGVALCVVLLGIPTFFSDMYFTSAIQDPHRTGYVRTTDMEALKWIRRNLPEQSVVQSEPNYSQSCGATESDTVAAISLIPDFAERREVVGEWYAAGTTLVNSKAEETRRAHDITRMFSSQDAAEVFEISSKYGIGYLYIGPCEQEKYPRILGVLESASSMFKTIYERDGVHIFERLHRAMSVSTSISLEGRLLSSH